MALYTMSFSMAHIKAQNGLEIIKIFWDVPIELSIMGTITSCHAVLYLIQKLPRKKC
jgi:hypothetical protein